MSSTLAVRRATVALATALTALLGACILDSGVHAQPAVRSESPPPDPESISLSSAPVVGPGGAVHFVGFCQREVGAIEASVRAIQAVEPEVEPIELTVVVNLNSTGDFLRHITVPANAPNGLYRLQLTCTYPSGTRGRATQYFTVDGPFVTTTSTPLKAVPRVPAPAPAAPVRGTATLTG